MKYREINPPEAFILIIDPRVWPLRPLFLRGCRKRYRAIRIWFGPISVAIAPLNSSRSGAAR